ncbi:acyl-CoA N-acyltransferase [Apiospora phragmitis]|uniref:Acyl-CoA N-acyltransferase n=1 Tax=Apiospora phragmitis TaxID=2905665 RepID=A0ABR1VEQ4_9PEZI
MAPQEQERFTLTRATADDMDEVARLQYDCFPAFIREKFMGCRSEADLPRVAERAREDMRTNVHDVWILVRDAGPDGGGKGKLAAASNWRVYLNGAAARASDDAPMPWLTERGDTEALAKAQSVIDEMNAARKAANPDGFLHLHICFTHPEYRRKGAGSLMLQWGCDLADQLALPGWIEASVEGNFLYKVHGFYDVGKLKDQGAMSGTFMKRDPSTKLGVAKAGDSRAD